MYIIYSSSVFAQQPPVGQSLLIHDVSRSRTTTYHRLQDSSGRVISPTQRPLPENTQHSQQTSITPVGFERTIPASQRPQTHALDRADTRIGQKCEYSKRTCSINFNVCFKHVIEYNRVTKNFTPYIYH